MSISIVNQDFIASKSDAIILPIRDFKNPESPFARAYPTAVWFIREAMTKPLLPSYSDIFSLEDADGCPFAYCILAYSIDDDLEQEKRADKVRREAFAHAMVKAIKVKLSML